MQFKKFPTVLAAFVVMGGTIFASASPALANDHGQCNGPSHQVVRKTTDLEVIVKAEGKKALAKLKALARKRGWSERDGSFHAWLRDRTIILRTDHEIKILDYYCPKGQHTMKVWKEKTIPPGTPMVVVLPDNVDKNDVSTKPKAGFEKSEPEQQNSLALVLCSNGALAIKWFQSLWFRAGKEQSKPKPEEQPKPSVTQEQPKPQQTPTGDCNGNNSSSGNAGSTTGNCNRMGDCNGVDNCNVIVFPPCELCGQQPCNCSSAPGPKIVSIVSPEEVEANGETYPMYARVSSTGGHSITVTFSADYGSFSTWRYTITSTGVDQVDTVYKAPSDVTAIGRSERIKVTVHDNSVATDDDVEYSMSFPIQKPTQPGGCC
jgi:hypothetical protein